MRNCDGTFAKPVRRAHDLHTAACPDCGVRFSDSEMIKGIHAGHPTFVIPAHAEGSKLVNKEML